MIFLHEGGLAEQMSTSRLKSTSQQVFCHRGAVLTSSASRQYPWRKRRSSHSGEGTFLSYKTEKMEKSDVQTISQQLREL